MIDKGQSHAAIEVIEWRNLSVTYAMLLCSFVAKTPAVHIVKTALPGECNSHTINEHRAQVASHLRTTLNPKAAGRVAGCVRKHDRHLLHPRNIFPRHTRYSVHKFLIDPCKVCQRGWLKAGCKRRENVTYRCATTKMEDTRVLLLRASICDLCSSDVLGCSQCLAA